MNSKIIFAIVLGVLVVAVGYFAMSISYKNKEIGLRNQIMAQQDSNEVVFDKVWKVLKQQAGVADEAKEAFKEIYIPLMEGRYGQGDGSLMKWVTEQNPNFDTSMYKQLMASIEANRGEFQREQKKLIDFQMAHNNLIQKFPGSFFLSSVEPIEIQLVTSGNTKQTFETGEENDVSLF